MNDTKQRLAEGAAILERGRGADPREREIVDRELRELEQDILADPGALSRAARSGSPTDGPGSTAVE